MLDMDTFVYVLKLEDECWYVGYSTQIIHRLRQHFSGLGAKWTQMHKPIKLFCLYPVVDVEEAKKLEKIVTSEYVSKYGQDAIRGTPTVSAT